MATENPTGDASNLGEAVFYLRADTNELDAALASSKTKIETTTNDVAAQAKNTGSIFQRLGQSIKSGAGTTATVAAASMIRLGTVTTGAALRVGSLVSSVLRLGSVFSGLVVPAALLLLPVLLEKITKWIDRIIAGSARAAEEVQASFEKVASGLVNADGYFTRQLASNASKLEQDIASNKDKIMAAYQETIAAAEAAGKKINRAQLDATLGISLQAAEDAARKRAAQAAADAANELYSKLMIDSIQDPIARIMAEYEQKIAEMTEQLSRATTDSQRAAIEGVISLYRLIRNQRVIELEKEMRDRLEAERKADEEARQRREKEEREAEIRRAEEQKRRLEEERRFREQMTSAERQRFSELINTLSQLSGDVRIINDSLRRVGQVVNR